MADVFYAKQKDYIFRLNKMAADLQAAFTVVQADWTATTGPTVIQHKPILATVATSGSYADLTNKPTKSDFGLGNVDNTSDANKPISAAAQTALNLKTTSTTLAASGGAALVGNTPAGNVTATTVQAAINELSTKKEPVITAGTTSQYYRGDKSFQDLGTDVRTTTLTGLSTATSTAVVATDSILAGAGKLQAQFNTTTSRLGDGGGFGFRNRIINGLANVGRAAGTFTNSSSGYGGPSRFQAGNLNGAGGTFVQATGQLVSGNVTYNTVRQTVSAVITDASTNKIWLGITQQIESSYCYDLIGKPIVVSFLFKSTVAGTYSVALRDAANTNSFLSSFVVSANTVTRVTVKIPAIPVAVSIPFSNSAGLILTVGSLNFGTFNTAASTSWQTGNYVTATGSTNWALSNGNYIELTQLQLEEGTAPSGYEFRPFTLDVALCQRYYQTYDFSFQAYGPTGGYISDTIFFKTPMRTTPLGAITGGAFTNVSTNLLENLNIDCARYTIQVGSSGIAIANGLTLTFNAEL